jgi:hypothetical protein
MESRQALETLVRLTGKHTILPSVRCLPICTCLTTLHPHTGSGSTTCSGAFYQHAKEVSLPESCRAGHGRSRNQLAL